MHRQSTEFAPLLKRSEYRTENICKSIHKKHLTFQASSGQPVDDWQENYLRTFSQIVYVGIHLLPENRKRLNLQVEATHVELIPRSSRDANYAIKRCCSPSHFPFSDYIFQIPLPSSKLINANCDPDFSYIKFCPFLDKTVKYGLSYKLNE